MLIVGFLRHETFRKNGAGPGQDLALPLTVLCQLHPRESAASRAVTFVLKAGPEQAGAPSEKCKKRT